ncbi:MAG: glutamine--fructose-6-phosphate transaminase (isomerizing) [Chlamydiae bacterium CG10_big_fil_rev_8_21_14_0_10_35_9]|nr:MAG: glutamine--fructose-6-phosphate transaminase (isomerizing) [Chlamydiae bacterium CG10_big_fil_rev_8_21_14_0_10_35_9]
MCGIFGYIGKNAVEMCLQGLKLLEYRGYDSSGIAYIKDSSLYIQKSIGPLNNLEKKALQAKGDIPIIGHTRWATHGAANLENAHPHTDITQSLAIVHNGIIENYTELREKFQFNQLASETDTEIIACLISYFYEKDLLQAVIKTLKLLKGSYALAIIHKDYPDQIIATCNQSPLAIGYSENQAFVASDVHAFSGINLHSVILKNYEVAVIKKGKALFFNQSLQSIEKKAEKIFIDHHSISKQGFQHFMMKEIHEQPITFQNAIANRFSLEAGQIFFHELQDLKPLLKNINHVVIVGCGSSWHAGLMGAQLIEKKAHILTTCEIASEFRYKDPLLSKKSLVFAISQSGETADTIAAVKIAKEKGATVVGICNKENSSLEREAEKTVFLHAGPEISVCSTKAFLSQLAVLSLLANYLGSINNSLSKEYISEYLHELVQIPLKIQQVLSDKDQLEKLASKYSHYDQMLFIGRNLMAAASLEAALKLKEISYINAQAYPAGELKHGPIALLDETLPVIGLCLNSLTLEKTVSNLMEAKARNAPVICFTYEGSKDIPSVFQDTIYLPPTIDDLAPFTVCTATQLFAYFVAKKRNCNIDKPRNLAKSVTVE